MRLSAWSILAAAAFFTRAAAGQVATGALEIFEPTPAGDAFFGVPSPSVGGHLVVRGKVVFDDAYRPLAIVDRDGTSQALVAQQAYLHAGLSLALWDRLLVSADMPFALIQRGDGATLGGARIASPSSAQVGDLRLGARARLFGGFWDPFQLGLGGYVFAPTAPARSYAGDGSVRGEPQIVAGGRLPHFVWSAALGATLRASSHPHAFDASAAAALVLGEDVLQIGPELTLAVPFTKDTSLGTTTTPLTPVATVPGELLIAAKTRLFRSFVVGAGAGPGLSHAYGTPLFFGALSVGYEPLPPRPKATAVATTPAPPKDSDGDAIPDAEDACPKLAGVASSDSRKNGCPPDGDADGIPDADDACPKVAGVASSDPKKNGCPPDADGDGIPDAEDACPDQRGASDPDPKKNGCPRVVVTKTEIVITRQVKFLSGKFALDQTVDPVSDSLLDEVRDAIQRHTEIERIEVQGHTDDVGEAQYNQRLSQARAEAVRTWLVKKGIPSHMLVAKGYGPTRPIATNLTDAGRQANRRVQFMIVKAPRR